MSDDMFLTVPEVARILRMSDGNVYTMVKQNRIPNVKIGRRYVIPRKQFDKWLSGNLAGCSQPLE